MLLIGYHRIYEVRFLPRGCRPALREHCYLSLSHALTKLFDVLTDSHLFAFQELCNICSQLEMVFNFYPFLLTYPSLRYQIPPVTLLHSNTDSG